MIQAIFFDLGGVLFTNGTKKFVEYLTKTYSLDPDLIKETIDKGELPDAYRMGKISRDEF
jgi:hypothetical protein